MTAVHDYTLTLQVSERSSVNRGHHSRVVVEKKKKVYKSLCFLTCFQLNVLIISEKKTLVLGNGSQGLCLNYVFYCDYVK